MPETQLLRAFRFRVALLRSPEAVAGGAARAPTGAAGGFSAGFSAGVSVAAGASVGMSAGAAAGASFSAGITLGGGIGLGDGSFAECTGLDVEMDVQELQEGGRNDGVIRRVGHARYQDLVLKRGMLHPRGGAVDRELWRWLQDVVAGVRPVRRYDGIVEVMGVGDAVAARWSFARGLPAKLTGPQLNAQTGEVAIEELHIAHEGLRLVA